jgi:hypothetical protein
MMASTQRGRQVRVELFELLQPMALANCQLERFGEEHDGGYLMCANLLRDVQSGYSYGINGYDQWGCDVSTRLSIPVHQYDCFNITQPVCAEGNTTFHAECVGDSTAAVEGRVFDTIWNQFGKNGDRSERIVLKGAEWDSFLSAPDEVFERIDQMAVEFHRAHDEKYVRVVRRLKQFFEIAHIHFNNVSCTPGLEPFPAWAYEVLFVSKRLAVVDPARKPAALDSLDAPNNPTRPDCQPTGS